MKYPKRMVELLDSGRPAKYPKGMGRALKIARNRGLRINLGFLESSIDRPDIEGLYARGNAYITLFRNPRTGKYPKSTVNVNTVFHELGHHYHLRQKPVQRAHALRKLTKHDARIARRARLDDFDRSRSWADEVQAVRYGIKNSPTHRADWADNKKILGHYGKTLDVPPRRVNRQLESLKRYARMLRHKRLSQRQIEQRRHAGRMSGLKRRNIN